jgi:predicted MFS family arabinose efflux permease
MIRRPRLDRRWHTAEPGTVTLTTTWTRPQRVAFGVLLALTMASSTFALTAFSVLSGSLFDTFALRRWQLGALVMAAAGVGACASPALGQLSDRLGGRGALQLTLGLSALTLAGIALSPVYLALTAAALVSGLAQATANPATNKLIGLHVAGGSRGTVTGIKQAGVQVGVFLGGALLPLGAVHVGWRPTVLIAATVPLIGLLVSHRLLPSAPSRGERPPVRSAVSRSPFLLRLALYGFLIGAGWSAVFTYLPDYAQSAFGWGPTAAGLLVSVSGLCGIVGRVGWSRLAEQRLGASTTLIALAAIGLVAVVSMLFAGKAQPLLWAASAALGASSGSWNSVGMLAIIDRMPTDIAGAASGVVMFGFLIGLGVGAPPFGWAVDLTGSYAPGLVAVALVHAAGLWVARTLHGAPIAAKGSAT